MTEYLKMVPLPFWWQKLDLNELYHRPNLELACNVGSRLFFLFTGLLCLGISLKLPPLAGLVEKLEEFLEEAGKGTDMTTVIPILIPDDFIAGSGGNMSHHILDFTPNRGARF